MINKHLLNQWMNWLNFTTTRYNVLLKDRNTDLSISGATGSLQWGSVSNEYSPSRCPLNSKFFLGNLLLHYKDYLCIIFPSVAGYIFFFSFFWLYSVKFSLVPTPPWLYSFMWDGKVELPKHSYSLVWPIGHWCLFLHCSLISVSLWMLQKAKSVVESKDKDLERKVSSIE